MATMSGYDPVAAEAEARDAAGLDRLRAEYTPMLLRTTAARMQTRVDAILERDGDQKIAIEGRGAGIGFLFAREIVHALEAGHDEIERLQSELASLRDATEQLRGELLVARATSQRTGEMLDKAVATLRLKRRDDPCANR
jgi:hypothetical protein